MAFTLLHKVVNYAEYYGITQVNGNYFFGDDAEEKVVTEGTDSAIEFTRSHDAFRALSTPFQKSAYTKTTKYPAQPIIRMNGSLRSHIEAANPDIVIVTYEKPEDIAD